MNRQEAAKILDGCQYRDEGSKEFFSEMKASGLVAVYGASDDLMIFDGAIRDEVGCFDGGEAFLTSHGLVENACEHYDCPHFIQACHAASKITAIWCPTDELSWSYQTDIPHDSFLVLEDDETYCQGIVFALKDAAAA